jgi:hypothetical protein
VLSPAKAGVGSAVNDATREAGGALGVAVIGSVFASAYLHRLTTSPLPALPAPAFAAPATRWPPRLRSPGMRRAHRTLSRP